MHEKLLSETNPVKKQLGTVALTQERKALVVIVGNLSDMSKAFPVVLSFLTQVDSSLLRLVNIERDSRGSRTATTTRLIHGSDKVTATKQIMLGPGRSDLLDCALGTTDPGPAE